MVFKPTLVASIAKDNSSPELNEDAYHISQTCIALADGASESYDSKSWAELLVHAYTKNPKFSAEWIGHRSSEYKTSIDLGALSWSQQAAFERGSFAALLGVEFADDGHHVDILAIGDCLALHIRDEEILRSFPFRHGSEFDGRPELLSTLQKPNQFVEAANFFSTHSTTWSVQPHDQILLATDAVGHWLLTQSEALTHLATVHDATAFAQLVAEKRLNKTMRLDDSTILRFLIQENASQQQS